MIGMGTPGRPRLSENPTRAISVVAEESLIERFDAVRRDLGLNRSEAMRLMMRRFIEETHPTEKQSELPIAS